MPPQQKENLTKWIAIVLTLLTMISSVALALGADRERISQLEKSDARLERELAECKKDTREMVEHINDKLDRILIAFHGGKP